jgi:hypothetical protein
MEHFNFNEPADVFVGEGRLGKRSRMAYRRFPSGAEAIRYAIELQSADKLAATVMEVEEVRFGAAEIRSLYESADYPLPRRQA